MKGLARAVYGLVLRLFAAVFHPIALIVEIGLVGAGCVVYAVDLLAGRGWAFMAAGMFLLFFAALISKGLNNG